jgi:hypothetical protein
MTASVDSKIKNMKASVEYGRIKEGSGEKQRSVESVF